MGGNIMKEKKMDEILDKIHEIIKSPQQVKFRFIMTFDEINVEYDYSLN